MFGRFKEKREVRKKEKAARQKKWEEKMLNSRRVSFCLQDVEFMDYYIPDNLIACENTLSLYETDEKSYNDKVMQIFGEIAKKLTMQYHVMQWLRWSNVEPMPAIKKYKAGEDAIFDDRFIVKCCGNGIDDEMMNLQMGEENHWDFIEQECYCYVNEVSALGSVEDATAYIEEVPCDLYIMIDLMHGALMVKTRKAEDLKKVEECMRRICDKYEKFVYDYIGTWK